MDGKCVVAYRRTAVSVVAVDVVELVAVTCYKALLLLLHVAAELSVVTFINKIVSSLNSWVPTSYN